MKQYNGEKYIVSFTTFPERFQYAAMMVFLLLTQQTYKDIHIVMTLYKDDYAKLNGDLKRIVDADKIEVIVADENLCPHLKYFYAMQKYHNKPIITVDDDRIYTPNTIAGLVSKYESIPYKSIISVCAPCMRANSTLTALLPYAEWCNYDTRLKPNETSFIAMAEGFADILYPPECFNMDAINISEVQKILFHDDLYLKVLGIRNSVPVTQVNGRNGVEFNQYDIDGSQKFSLAEHNNAPCAYREQVVSLFVFDLLAGFRL